MDGEYIAMSFLPFEEASSTRRCEASSNTSGGTRRTDSRSTAGPLASRLLEAARATVAEVGVNGLTRRSFLDAGIPTLTRFDAGGMLGTANIADKVSTPCFVLVQLRDGRFVREHPKKKGTFDCKPSNRLGIKADLLGR